VLLWLNLEER